MHPAPLGDANSQGLGWLISPAFRLTKADSILGIRGSQYCAFATLDKAKM
jgi:hypothetical protein